MKIGIIGDPVRGNAWERHLRPHHIVSEVIISPTLKDLPTVDACFIVVESASNLQVLLDCIHQGYHAFFIEQMPDDIPMLEKITRAGREAGVHVQFSHWPTLAPATQWMMDEMHRPQYIQIEKDINRNQLVHIAREFRNHWLDELGLCLKWIDSGVHHIEARQSNLGNDQHPSLIQIFVRFDNGATASIHLNSTATENRHVRLISDHQQLFSCNVPTQEVKLGRMNPSNRLFFEKKKFEPSSAAEKAASLFLKAIQLNKEPVYTAYDALQLARLCRKAVERSGQFR